MQLSKVVESCVESSTEPLDLGDILNSILPVRNEPYTLDDIDNRLHSVRDEVEELERRHNNQFDIKLTTDILDKIDNLYRSLHNTQLDVMKLQCDIAFTKEQSNTVNSVCNNPVVRDRRELLAEEQELTQALHQLKFEPLKDFFQLFANHLESALEVSRRLCIHQATNYLQLFDWTQYRQTILLLRACGKALMDVRKFELLYQSDADITALVFKQPINQIDFNNLIKFQDTYSLDTQLEITTGANRRQDLKDFFAELSQHPDSTERKSTKYIVFESLYIKLRSIDWECCKLLIDLNMNYVEAYLTEGINIDKLNGIEDGPSPASSNQSLPLYAFSPQDYITKIGQHLLTLKKQTEQFDSMNNEPLMYGLRFLKDVQDIPMDIESCRSVTETVMKCIARHCIRSLLGRTSNSILSKLTVNGKRQLATDALYLDNVLEDLKLLDLNEPNVKKFKSLLVQQ